MPTVNLNHRPRLADLRRLGGTLSLLSPVTARKAVRRTPAEELRNRLGYQSDFLGPFKVTWPRLVEERAHDALEVPGKDTYRLDYTHFSITLSKSRRLALIAGVNIEGSQMVDVPRSNDRWALDGRVADDAQAGEWLYSDNLLDRGHLVRRQDPNWGSDAEQANADTFHFTNCAPQMASFNQKNWLDLEDYLLENTRRWQARATVFTGPVFGENDQEYRGVRIPKAFWKVVAFLSDDGKPSATAYMVDQSRDLERLEAAFGRFRTYQRSVAYVEHVTGLDFGSLSRYDGFSNEERETGTRIEAELLTLDDIQL
ncbi:DNA/RNA non-specific endonuclease [Pseudomonas matsuisoli]|uniref:Endonuclease n=1 Tax=Pseudomonas matsuisoli TaxID=1515666 RepID=A0A917PM80_9PSED|nr:DNA/RNA non-specific endonuclease [Pseudomonas matsuisoli]GGJ84641.1 endonuclease [Pseudomonas matsuisoli]